MQGDQFLLAFRKINVDQSILESTIDAYLSTDRCQSWQYLSTVKEIKHNSNPPAMVQLDDGRLCCIYGDRDTAKLCGKYSSDSGKTWGSEFTLRDNYEKSDDSDDSTAWHGASGHNTDRYAEKPIPADQDSFALLSGSQAT